MNSPHTFSILRHLLHLYNISDDHGLHIIDDEFVVGEIGRLFVFEIANRDANSLLSVKHLILVWSCSSNTFRAVVALLGLFHVFG